MTSSLGVVQIRFDGGEAVPAADGHHYTRVHLLVDEESLGEPATEIVRAHLLEIGVAGLVGRSLGDPADYGPDARLCQADVRVFRCDVVLVLVALEVALDAVGEVGVTSVAAVPAGVFPGTDSEAVLVAVGLFDVDPSFHELREHATVRHQRAFPTTFETV